MAESTTSSGEDDTTDQTGGEASTGNEAASVTDNAASLAGEPPETLRERQHELTDLTTPARPAPAARPARPQDLVMKTPDGTGRTLETLDRGNDDWPSPALSPLLRRDGTWKKGKSAADRKLDGDDDEYE
jgi:hypothetical protein